MLSRLWKPVFQKAVTGRARRFRMRPGAQPPSPPLETAGLYLHVPFCESLCPFCPYNRTRYEPEAFARYERAVKQEIDLRGPGLARSRIGSLYIGGGTPTVDWEGLTRIVTYMRDRLALSGDICIELHPAHMKDDCLERLKELGVTLLSLGVESTSDTILERIGRKHDAATALDALRRALTFGFKTVNVDLMFALPGQTIDDWERDLDRVLSAGAEQLSTYPLFSFPYSELGRERGSHRIERPDSSLVRAMLERTDDQARRHGLVRCAVWSWIKPEKNKFSSITRHHYVGFGPSAASMTGSSFSVNTFDVDAYSDSLPDRAPVALHMPVDTRLEMAYWLYWRTYELSIDNREFRRLFGESESLHRRFGPLMAPFRAVGMIRRDGERYEITRSGAYWIHRLQNEYSLNYINKLWGTCRKAAWPKEACF